MVPSRVLEEWKIKGDQKVSEWCDEFAKSKAQPGAIRKAIEEEIRTTEGQEHWRCVAVMKDARNYNRMKVVCRDETELQRVRTAAEKTALIGARVLRDQLFPVKVDNANRTAILDQDGKLLPGATEVLGKENDVHIAKIAWLSRKDIGNAYGSMVVYVTKSSVDYSLSEGLEHQRPATSRISSQPNFLKPRLLISSSGSTFSTHSTVPQHAA